MPFAAIALGAVLGAASLPPCWFPGAEVLVFGSLAVQFALATGTRRPVLANYWLGVLYFLVFSWSLRHVTFAGYLAVAALGGGYHALVALATKRARWPVLAFAVAVAGACWLRAEMPGIAYPHGQPAHVFWRTPWLLAPVVLGGEPLQNALLAALAAAFVQLARAWRTAVVPMRSALRTLALVLAIAVATSLPFALRSAIEPARQGSVAIAAIESGLHSLDAISDVPSGDRAALDERFRKLIGERLVEPTNRIASRRAPAPPALVLWPESSIGVPVLVDAKGALRFDALRMRLLLAEDTHVLFGGLVERDRRFTPAAVLVDDHGEFVAHHEKQCLVPGGETLPGLSLLPEELAQRISVFLQTAVGLPDLVPGRALPPLQLPTANGRVPFVGLVCYDNAFPGPFAVAAEQGARFCAVLSNECWYRGESEPDQLAAITVLRALAHAMPIVRSTTDGRTMAVDGNGRVLAELSPAPGMQPAARVLRVDLPLGAGSLPPMARLHPWLGWLAVGALLWPFLHGLLAWVTLLRPTRSAAGAPGASRSDDPLGGS